MIILDGLFPGQGQGFDIDLIKLVSDAVSIPVIASSGAGNAAHFSEVFSKTNASAALAAGIFHRKEVMIKEDNDQFVLVLIQKVYKQLVTVLFQVF